MNKDKKMAAESDKGRIKDGRNIKEVRIPEQKKERPVPRKTNSLVEHLHIRTIVQYLDVQIQGRQKATIMSVCVKGKELVQKKQCAYIVVRATVNRKG